MSKETDAIDLLELNPEQAVVQLWKGSNLVDYNLRPVDMSDEAWIRRHFGDGIQEVFSQLQMEPICKIIFHQLEDKADFAAREVEEYDDDGVKCMVRLTGPQLVMKAVKGKKHQFQVIQALLKTIGWSRPILTEDETKQVEQKKKVKKKKKVQAPTGAKSTI